MKKVIFISALAIAAAVSCTKSDIVDTKFDDAIGFEAYVGRDAQTKAEVIDNSYEGNFAVYAYYTGNAEWSTSSPTNLWDGVIQVNKAGTIVVPTDAKDKYWANPDDLYSFFAYAPVDAVKVGTPSTQNPIINFTVQDEIPAQVDLLYADVANIKNKKPADFAGGKVTLNMKHALSRITVKAKAEAGDFKFDVKEITLEGAFNVKGNLPLSTGEWTGEAVATEGKTKFEIFANNKNVVDGKTTYGTYEDDNALPTGSYKNYATRTVPEGETTKDVTDNYLMIIPTVPAEGATPANATLRVYYTTYYAEQESVVMYKDIQVPISFEKGKAYSINLLFSHTTQKITFEVVVTDWNPTADPDGNDASVKPADSTTVKE